MRIHGIHDERCRRRVVGRHVETPTAGGFLFFLREVLLLEHEPRRRCVPAALTRLRTPSPPAHDAEAPRRVAACSSS
eukprot:3463554-Prymnesium_polylepis.1